MGQSEMKAVELVRQIRDRHWEQLHDESREELKAFFHREATAAQEEAKRLLRHKHAAAASRT